MNTYKMTYIGGVSGNEFDGGDWTLKETPSYYIFTAVDPNDEIYGETTLRLIKDKTKWRGGGNPFEIDDGEFIVYPLQSGTPHIFRPEETIEQLEIF